MFTQEQHDALNQVLASLGSNERCNVFAVLSSAGCGKTIFGNGLAAVLRSRGTSVVSVASSALAAMLLTHGTTAHSRFRIPIPANEYSVCNLTREERLELASAVVILWDECSMIHKDVADTVDRTLRDIMRDPRPFGGKTVVFTGDFKQLLPVVRRGRGHDHTMQRCAWWRDVKVVTFTFNWRALQSPVFSAFLEEVGNGRVDFVEVPSDRIVDDFDAMIDAVYGTTFDCCNQILALTLETCAEVNRMCIDRLPGTLHERPAVDSYDDCTDLDSFPPDYVESLHMNGAPPFMLRLKLGAKFMCIRNIAQRRGLVNGTMLQVVGIGRRFIQVRVLTGKSAGSVELLMPHVFSISPDASGLPFTITRRQYPMIPAYCLSVHKAQGQTIKVCGLIFESDPFTHGQLYVALSRVASWLCLFVKLHHKEHNIHNVVLKHLLGEL
jgi:ATP-dependent DNA helicase PIF1